MPAASPFQALPFPAVALAGILAVAALAPAAAHGQGSPTATDEPEGAMPGQSAAETAGGSRAKRIDFLCGNVRNPRKRPYECRAQGPSDLEDGIERTLTQAGAELAQLGIVPSLAYTAQILTNTSGVTPTATQEILYAGQLNGSVNLDFHRLVGIPGLSFYVGATWGTGGTMMVGTGGNYFQVASAAAGTGFWLEEMYLQAALLHGSLDVAAGRLTAGATFATLPAFGNYLNGGINANPGALVTDIPSFPAPPPGTQWGAQAIWYPGGNWRAAAGIFNTNLRSAAGADHGADFRWSEGNRGVLVIAQASWLPNQAHGQGGPPGHYSLGAYHDGNYFPLLPSRTVNTTGNWGLYAMFQQSLFRPDDTGVLAGLSAWGAFTWTSLSDRNALPFSAMAGLSWQGVLPGRREDVLSVGWSSGRVSPSIPGTTGETLLEVNYAYNPWAWLSIMPDFQYVWRPGGYDVQGAALAGLQVVITP
jgi:porin